MLTGHRGDVVRVEWLDAHVRHTDISDDWIQQAGTSGGTPVTTVGILILRNSRCVILAQSRYNNLFEPWDEAVCIPRSLITEMILIEENDAHK